MGVNKSESVVSHAERGIAFHTLSEYSVDNTASTVSTPVLTVLRDVALHDALIGTIQVAAVLH